MTEQISISELYRAISGMDTSGDYKQVSYNLTSHNILSSSAWWVFMPYGQWGDSQPPAPSAPNPSPLEAAILQAIPPSSSNKCFIDILSLAPSYLSFFDDTNATSTIANQLANFINGLPNSVTPVIRYLEGNTPGATPNPSACGLIQALFNENGNLITQQNAYFYYGSFAPSFQFASGGSDTEISGGRDWIEGEIEKLWHWLENKIKALWQRLMTEINNNYQALYQELRKIETEIVSWIRRYIGHVLTSTVSWNHAKIFAINGTNLITGGANYWPNYTTSQPSTPQTWLFDLSMSITGDAAGDAHQFANYLWQYLNAIPPTDTSSWCMGNLMSNPISGFQNKTAPIYNQSPQNDGTISALTVGKNGNWPFHILGFPTQMFDATRDFLLNVIAVIVETHVSNTIDATAFVAKWLSDDNPSFREILSDAMINPTAWASRYVRNYAVSRAQTSVRFSQQKFVMDDLVADQNTEYLNLVTEINSYIKADWNGYVWPYDMLLSLGYALTNISNNDSGATGIEIVTSCLLGTNSQGYEDPVSVGDFTDKLSGIMNGMQILGYISPTDSISDIITNFFSYRRIDNSTTAPQHGNHAKLVVVDDAICYIGSDNAYPSYNEEFGVWIDDEASISSFIQGYWNDLWAFAQPDS